MATFYKRPGPQGTRWQAKVRLRGQVRSFCFDRKTDAKAWATEVERELRRGKRVPTTTQLRRTVSDLIDRYLEEALPTKRHNRDSDQLERHLRWWKERIGDARLVDVDPDLIAECRDELAKGKPKRGSANKHRSPGTVNRYLTSLSVAFQVAMSQWQWLDENAVRRVSKLAEPKGRVRFLDDAERQALLTACRESDDPNLYPAVVLALSTGMRAGEIRSLTWDAVDLKHRRIVLTDTKNRDTRAVPLVGHALEVLRARAKVRRIDTPLVFPGRKKGRPADLRDAWTAALAEAGVEDFRFHDLRHSAASYLLMNGATLGELSEVLGHKTLAMVKRYAHLSDQHAAGVVARMNAAIFPDELA